jgi:ParB family chromosome partitioning protein
VLSAGHAKALVSIDDIGWQERLAARVVAEGLSVRATEEMVTLGTDEEPAETRRRRSSRSRSAPELEERLADRLDTRVRVQAGPSRGRIVIDFATQEDLLRIADLIAPTAG